MAEQTKVIPNNCVSEIKVPRRVRNVNGVDYNPALGLYATFNDDGVVSVWNPVSGNVVAEFRGFGENSLEVLFVPGNRLAVSSSLAHHGGSIEIFKIGEVKSYSTELVKREEDNDKGHEEGQDKEEDYEEDEDEDEDEDEEEHSKAEIIIDYKDLLMTYPGPICLSPGGNLLVTDAVSGGEGVYEIFIDWDNSKFLKFREISEGHEEAESGIGALCCSPDFKVAMFSFEPPLLSSTTVRLNSEGEVETSQQERITYYMLNGEEESVGEVYGLAHDGKNLIIANKDEIVLLDTMTEGSTAHLIASGIKLSGQMGLNYEGQLMVCQEEVIKLFNYKSNPRSLQDLCRCHFRKSICTGYIDKVISLEIPSVLKDYLLFK